MEVRRHAHGRGPLNRPRFALPPLLVGREMFVRMVLDGDPGRGMPGYREDPYVAPAMDDIYRYFAARADNEIGAGHRPPPQLDKRWRGSS